MYANLEDDNSILRLLLVEHDNLADHRYTIQTTVLRIF